MMMKSAVISKSALARNAELNTFVDAGTNLREWYEGKTAALLHKYGACGTRVHYHTGPARAIEDASATAIRRAMWQAQEDELRDAFMRWHEHVDLHGRFLDVGCGLGGAMQWLMDEAGISDIEGLTIAPSHARVAKMLARQAFHDLEVHVGDANEWVGGTYDVIYSIQASCLFRRDQWFPRAAHMLKRGGALLIDDYVSLDPTFNAPFDGAYASNVATREEYLRLAERNGFKLVDEQDRTEKSVPFWELCARYSELDEREGWHHPPSFHRGMFEAQSTRRCEHRLFAFVRVR